MQNGREVAMHILCEMILDWALTCSNLVAAKKAKETYFKLINLNTTGICNLSTI